MQLTNRSTRHPGRRKLSRTVTSLAPRLRVCSTVRRFCASSMNRTFLVLSLAVVFLASVAAACASEPTLEDWCLDLLRQAKEPVSLRNTAGVEHFRLIFRQSFSVPIVIRVTKAGDRVTLGSVLFATNVPDARIKALNPKDWANLTTLAKNASFWTMPYDDNGGGLDGTSLIIEAFRADGTYHVVTRSSVSYNAKDRQLTGFVALGKHLSRLSPHKLQLY